MTLHKLLDFELQVASKYLVHKAQHKCGLGSFVPLMLRMTKRPEPSLLPLPSPMLIVHFKKFSPDSPVILPA